ncbi:bisdemethoxycurcumin synthase-like [Triticum dicoccoides]|uniref:bisdemethoxycurcumin synthase-like n=1 Tax=Triticum dicoccoides TaxID=85692 RepID=UPI000842AE63|nr:bisdemethoxycurcumin synthase-like [Triticum dicoccoides]XP_044367635.1 bisdemethoxycurcumin synthase-like [Triticum aestivum]
MRRAQGPAAVLAIGTANPVNCMSQDEFLDLYFRATQSEHLTSLKDDFRRLYGKLSVQKRYFHHTEEVLSAHLEIIDPSSPSLDTRLEIVRDAVPELAAKASVNAITEWGRPATDITHLVVTTNSGAHVPGVDFRLMGLLGLRPSVRRSMLYLNGCFAGSAALRLAKDLAENNRGARVLVVCAELTIMLLRGPKEDCYQTIVDHGHFGDGAGAVIVGADPTTSPAERPLFHMVAATQTVIPESDHAINLRLTEDGLRGYLAPGKEVPVLIGDNIQQCLLDSFEPLGVQVKWNDLFWAMHPGSVPILDRIDEALQLEPEKLAPSRMVLREYGNMFGVSVIFVLDELRRRREMQGAEATPGWGVMMACGPGLTIETMILHAT